VRNLSLLDSENLISSSSALSSVYAERGEESEAPGCSSGLDKDLSRQVAVCSRKMSIPLWLTQSELMKHRHYRAFSGTEKKILRESQVRICGSRARVPVTYV